MLEKTIHDHLHIDGEGRGARILELLGIFQGCFIRLLLELKIYRIDSGIKMSHVLNFSEAPINCSCSAPDANVSSPSALNYINISMSTKVSLDP